MSNKFYKKVVKTVSKKMGRKPDSQNQNVSVWLVSLTGHKSDSKNYGIRFENSLRMPGTVSLAVVPMSDDCTEEERSDLELDFQRMMAKAAGGKAYGFEPKPEYLQTH